jgi:hypothetical protein
MSRRIVAVKADVRNIEQLGSAPITGVAELGHLDIVSANAEIFSVGRAADLTEAAWRKMIDINLTGVWHTAKESRCQSCPADDPDMAAAVRFARNADLLTAVRCGGHCYPDH